MIATTAHKQGDRVRSTVDAQGLRKGHTYVIEDLHEEHTPWGTFVTYIVTPAARTGAEPERLAIGNGHLILQAAPAA